MPPRHGPRALLLGRGPRPPAGLGPRLGISEEPTGLSQTDGFLGLCKGGYGTPFFWTYFHFQELGPHSPANLAWLDAMLGSLGDNGSVTRAVP